MKNAYFLTSVKGLLLFYFFMTISLQTFGQPNEGIQNIQPIPAIPNNVEVLQFDVDAYFVQSPCSMDYEVEILAYKVFIRICYYVGSLHFHCFPKDTVTIGQLPAGDFEFVFQAFKYHYDGGCFEQEISTDTILLTIVQHTSSGMPVEEAGITLHPNPFTDHFIIQVAQNALHRPISLRLYNYSGGEVLFRKMESGTAHRVSTEHLPPGVYLYRLELENGQEVNGKIVKY